MQRRTLFLIALVILVTVGWYVFRPERLFVNAKVNETFPMSTDEKAAPSDSSPMRLLSGRFHSVAHKSAGTATVFKLPDGNRVLRLADFETSNGPDVRVYVVAAQDAAESDTVTRSGFIDLGSLKGNIGDQNYDIPPNVDLNKYRAVTIWCRRFSVNFATAPLAE
jgi:hypothetical protein